MSRKYKFRSKERLYFISFSIIFWIDLFIRKEYKDVMIESWKFCQREKDLEIYGWCIMSSHVHMIVGTRGRPLEKTIGEMKSFTSRSLRKAIEQHKKESRKEWMLAMMQEAGIKNGNNKDWQLWQQHNHPLEISNKRMFQRVLNYIHKNPVKAGFTERTEDYWHSSAGDFNGRKGLIDLSYVE